MPKLFQNHEEDIEFLNERYNEVFFLVGKFVTTFQSIDDYLYDVFLSVMKSSSMMSSSLFELFLSLEARLRAITAASIDRDNRISDLWADLRPKIKALADYRNQIAHSTPITMGRGVVVNFDKDAGEGVVAGYMREHSDFKVRKKTKNGNQNWSIEDLQEILKDAETVRINLMTFSRIACDHPIPAHFKLAWDNPIIQNWPESSRV